MHLKNKPSVTTEKGRNRAQDILAVARRLLATDGYAGLSMRKVAAEVGISLSNVQHYYGDKDSLMEAVQLATLDEFQAQVDAIGAAMADAAPLDRFLSMVDMFIEKLSSPETQATFFELWALASRNAFASALMDKMMANERKAIFKLIRELQPCRSDEQTMQRAALIVAQVQGMMLFRLERHAKRAEVNAGRAALREAVVALATSP